MLAKNPKDRITVDNALKHAFFKKFRIGPTYLTSAAKKFVREDKDVSLM